ncbi:MAG: hypothetical protein V1872_14590 [bacterium]
MIKYLLKEIEKSPNPIFSKKELLSISPQDFKDLSNKKILAFRKPSNTDLENINLRCQHGCNLTVMPVGNELEAVCLNHPEEDPILIKKEELNRYLFSIDGLLFQIRSANKIDGNLDKINGGYYYYLGHKTYSNNRVGFIFIYNLNKGSLVEISGLKHLCNGDNILIVLTPSSTIEDVILKNILYHDKIVQTSLIASLTPQTFELPIESLISTFLKKSDITELSEGQKKEIKDHGYKCLDKIHIPGIKPKYKNNKIIVNAKELNIGDASFNLLIQFIVELKKKNGGWVTFNTEAGRYQTFSRLRGEFKGYLLDDKKLKKIIESNGQKQYRLSTLPDFVTYDKDKLIDHEDPSIRELAKDLI